MRWPAALLLGLLLVTGSASGDEGAASAPPTHQESADAVLAALRVGDEAALKARAGLDDPDPWLVADELVRRGELDAAAAFAKVAERVDTQGLTAYVASRRGAPDDAARRARQAAVAASLAKDDFEAAATALGPAQEAPPADVLDLRLAFARGRTLRGLRRFEEASAALLAAAEAAERLGWLSRASEAYEGVFRSAFRGSAFETAQIAVDRRLLLCERRQDRLGAAQTLILLGHLQQALGRNAEALATFERSLAATRTLGDEPGVAAALGGVSGAHVELGNYLKALEACEGSRAAYERLGDVGGAALALGNLGHIQGALGDWTGAVRTLERALAAKRALRDEEGAAATLGNIGVTHYLLGDYARALSSYEAALAVQEAFQQRVHAAGTLSNMAIVYGALGDHARALAMFERALAEQQATGDRSGEATTLGNIAASLLQQGEHARALELAERARAAAEELGDRASVARQWIGIGSIHFTRGDLALARDAYERAAAGADSVGDEQGTALARLGLGVVLDRLGDSEGALAEYRRALATQEGLGDRPGEALSLHNIAGLQARRGEHAQALATARRGVGIVARLAEGLAHGEVASARDAHADLFELGQTAALALDDLEALAWFLEQGRAGALRDAFASRAALEAAVLPDAVRRDLLLARAEERRALDAWQSARAQREPPAAIRQARAAFEQAETKVGSIASHAERSARAAATVALGRVDDLTTIRGHLAAGEALVLYGFDHPALTALVVERGGARPVVLGDAAEIEEAVGQLLDRVAQRAHSDDLAGVVAALTAKIVMPLSLGEDVRRVFVSPAGSLGYVPLAPLFGDRVVVHVPSGTMLGLLLAGRGRHGTGVLALGDPDYSASGSGRARLPPLPASRDEARAVGTVHLLGRAASESGLVAALAKQERWRAVHFACHGLLDAERPMFSSLALTSEEQEDGLLKALEIFPMRFAADLVVLSACETGTGKLYRTEGIASLAQAFMFAGAPRVICSLWKVDDAATQALMAEFYRLWNSKDGKTLGTAESLREAQRFVREHPGHPEWRHPYYWAAWVLWGLAD